VWCDATPLPLWGPESGREAYDWTGPGTKSPIFPDILVPTCEAGIRAVSGSRWLDAAGEGGW
jgi:hypothetical protein